MGYKSDRTAEDIKRELTVLVRELKDPRVNASFITVVRAEVAHDLSFCKAYVSSLEGIESAKTVCKILNGNAKGYLRKELGTRLGLRKTPDLKFIADDSIEKGAEMFKKLYDAEKKAEKKEDI
jgi:ribosome-binding factor A